MATVNFQQQNPQNVKVVRIDENDANCQSAASSEFSTSYYAGYCPMVILVFGPVERF